MCREVTQSWKGNGQKETGESNVRTGDLNKKSPQPRGGIERIVTPIGPEKGWSCVGTQGGTRRSRYRLLAEPRDQTTWNND